MQTIEIKTYADSYKDQIIDLILGIQVEEFNVPISIKDQPDLEMIATFYQKKNGNFWMALDGNKVVGTIALIDIGNSQSALRKMFVAKEYRGKDKGVALQLLNTVFNWCKEKSINEIYLGTVEVLRAAQRFYEKNGFMQINKTNLPVTFPVMALDTKFYKWRADCFNYCL